MNSSSKVILNCCIQYYVRQCTVRYVPYLMYSWSWKEFYLRAFSTYLVIRLNSTECTALFEELQYVLE